MLQHLISIYLSELLYIRGLFAHASEPVENSNGVVLSQEFIPIIEKYGNSIPEENFTALIQECVPDTNHCLVQQ